MIFSDVSFHIVVCLEGLVIPSPPSRVGSAISSLAELLNAFWPVIDGRRKKKKKKKKKKVFFFFLFFFFFFFLFIFLFFIFYIYFLLILIMIIIHNKQLQNNGIQLYTIK